MGNELTEIQSDLKSLIEISKLVRRDQERKNEVLFEFMNDTNKSLSQLAESMKNNKEYVHSVSENLKEHRASHFSFVKIIGVVVGAIGGVFALFDRMNK